MQLSPSRRVPLRAVAAGGFTLIELLVTLVVVAVGLMGLAKLQAAATAETQISRTRSLMTYQAESLAAAMRANRAYWANTAGTLPVVTIPAGATTGSYTSNDTTAYVDCGTRACTGAQIAAYDLTKWTIAFAKQFPAATGKITCTASSGPATCDVTLQWPERYVAINRSTAPAASDVAPTGTLVVHVQP